MVSACGGAGRWSRDYPSRRHGPQSAGGGTLRRAAGLGRPGPPGRPSGIWRTWTWTWTVIRRPDTRAHGSTRQAKASQQSNTRQDRSAFWFSINRRGGSVLLHHRHIRPVLIREWSPPMDGIPATIWASRTTSDLTSATPLARMRRATPRLAASHRPTGSGQTRERTGIALGPAPFLSAGSPQTRARSRAAAGADQRNIRRSAGTGTTGLRTRSAARAAGPQP